ncbi:hypothetical protein [Chromobacterium sp. IIBBL 290-4]|uniref:hypothetical protein n=1 Tax=Chromobacterium sp. IIBBL 290-4 TaxID=2953890 RepID=UPI0020B6761A|nr:hypothetical protein [Chromobacterium sp. IIBBL 290-4]UTH76369.1 hypothetical protein NKT35_09800 [Chromobacterium sp. IIBBL 290-4]
MTKMGWIFLFGGGWLALAMDTWAQILGGCGLALGLLGIWEAVRAKHESRLAIWSDGERIYWRKRLSVQAVSLSEVAGGQFFYRGDTPTGLRLRLADGSTRDCECMSLAKNYQEREIFAKDARQFCQGLGLPFDAGTGNWAAD